MNEDRKPTLTMEGTLPIVTVPLTGIAQGMTYDSHVASWESYGMRVSILVRASKLERPEQPEPKRKKKP